MTLGGIDLSFVWGNETVSRDLRRAQLSRAVDQRLDRAQETRPVLTVDARISPTSQLEQRRQDRRYLRYNMSMTAAGVSGANRAFLTALNRELRGAFTVTDAAVAAHVDRERAARLLRHLAAQGWVARVQRGLYTTVPLEVDDPKAWSADPWVIAMAALAPGYVGGWTALHHWDLTDQVFSTTLFVTTHPVPRRSRSIGGARYELRHRPKAALFGTRRVWRDGTPVEVSDRERTLVDCLDDPSLGGGLRHTTEALTAYAQASDVAWAQLVAYAEQLDNRTVFKRLGYLAEELGIGDEQLIETCRSRISAGTGRLDPAGPHTGATVARWGLQINARLDA